MVKVTSVSKKIGQNIRKLRMLAEISQEELAHKAGLNRAYIGYIERGERNPSTDTISKIAKVLKISPKDFFE